MAADPRFVQVLLLIRTAEPLGRRKYWPIYEAAVAHDLPVGIHFGGWGRGPITGVGYGSYYIEDTVGMATAFADQLTSLVCEGVFERFPELKIVLIEGGIAWLAPLMWRLDRACALLRAEAPQLTRDAVGADPRARLADDAADRRAAARGGLRHAAATTWG